MKKKILVILCSLLTVLLVGCGGSSNSSNSLIGQWVNEDESERDENPFELFSDSTAIEFFSDGTAIISYSSGLTNSVNWVVENERIKFTLDTGIFGNIASSYSYKLSGDTLILTDDDGEETTLYKS